MLKSKVVVITGGAGLIGQEFVKAVVEQNGIAIIADIDKEVGCRVQDSLSKEVNSNKIEFIKLDITSKASLQNCIEEIDNKYHPDHHNTVRLHPQRYKAQICGNCPRNKQQRHRDQPKQSRKTACTFLILNMEIYEIVFMNLHTNSLNIVDYNILDLGTSSRKKLSLYSK